MQPGETYTEPSLLEVILIYGGIPLLVVIAVVVLVSAPGWIRQGRDRSGTEGSSGVLVGARSTVERPAAIGAEPTGTAGGSSGTW